MPDASAASYAAPALSLRPQHAIREATQGEEVVIAREDGTAVRLVPVEQKARPRFGSARGLFTMADDFDAPLDDFAPYEQ